MFTRQCLINRMMKMDHLYIDSEVIDLLRDTEMHCPSDLEALIHQEVHLGMIRGFNLTDGTVLVEIPCGENGDAMWPHYSDLMIAVCKQARESKRTKAVRLDDCDKYMANAWLNRLGFGGPDYKDIRHALMKHLPGYAAFKDNSRMQAHKDKLAEQRRIRREMAGEANTND